MQLGDGRVGEAPRAGVQKVDRTRAVVHDVWVELLVAVDAHA
jgi:hypothetical protein